MALVEIKNNQVVVSSRQVAERFSKEHKHILDNIRQILAVENSATKFFLETTFDNRGKQYPEYLMNRDGFTLLAMGFTGKEALQWKLKYITAFNEMEAKLNGKEQLSIVKQQRAEAMLLNARSRQSKIWLDIADKTDIAEYKHICQQKAAETLAGVRVLPMEQAERKTYSASEIGKMVGMTANMVGRVTKRNNLRTEQYGKLFYDKSKYSGKEVETFRYYDTVVEALKELGAC